MDDCNEEPCDCCCDGAPLITGYTLTIGAVTANCEFDECAGRDLLWEFEHECEPVGQIDAFDHVLNALLQSFAGPLGPGVRRVIVSEPTPDGPITYLDRSRDGDDTPPSMLELIEG